MPNANTLHTEQTQVTPSLNTPEYELRPKSLFKEDAPPTNKYRLTSTAKPSSVRPGQFEIMNNLNKLQERINNLSRLYDE